ncbi:hypothetical protein FE257_007786 [Aspergillus nanangensis]|uniref:Uncharacterized protein n=1 Tax=Aspergillus nanangensis TaxID=2582783 RepID=A0AAD4H030_ASPNN|nr:hypothetical protein FE257_007786 [Aspergillus nanangensis]
MQAKAYKMLKAPITLVKPVSNISCIFIPLLEYLVKKIQDPTSNMKLLACFLVGVYATTSLARPIRSPNAGPNAEAECGPLGVMYYDPDELPKGFDPSGVRKCAEHPLGHDRPTEC